MTRLKINDLALWPSYFLRTALWKPARFLYIVLGGR
jgi:hypothetical protein